MNTSKTRNLYYVMDEKEEMFVKGNLNNHENSYTGEIDRAFRTYSKEEAIHISNECNDIGMNTKVVMFTWRCTLVARNVKGIENNSGIKGDRKLSELNAGETFKDGNGIEYIVCQQFENGTAAVVRKGLFDHRLYFGDTNDWRDSNIREYLNKEYFKELAAQFGEDNIVEFTRDLISLDGYDDYGKCRDKVSIMSLLDYMKYHKDIGDCENIYYLLTPATILSGCSYKTVLYIDDNDLPNYTLCSSIMAVRPFFVLKSDIYVSNKKKPFGFFLFCLVSSVILITSKR